MEWALRSLGCLLITAMLFTNCSAATYTWTHLGPTGGFVSSVAYDPATEGIIWASGDDSDGLYKYTVSGGTWNLISGVPVNQSTFALTIDPVNHNIYAPNYYGRGMLKSTDGGVTWTQGTGLPSAPPQKHVYSLAINPTSRNILVAATDVGLYISTDYGSTFSRIMTAGWGTIFTAVAYASNGALFAGNADANTGGTLEVSIDNGNTWTLLFTGGGTGIARLITTTYDLYILYQDATLVYFNMYTFAGGVLNSPVAGIATLHVDMAVHETTGTQNTDLIYIGTATPINQPGHAWGLYKTTNGGATFTQMGSNFAGNSVFSIAIDPLNSNNVAVGTINSNGLFLTTNGGTTWTQTNSTVLANSVLAFAQDPAVPQYMLVSSSVSLGLGTSYFTIDGGTTWYIFPEVSPSDGILSFDIDPGNYNNLLAGSFTTGIWHSTSGPYGTWSQVQAPPPPSLQPPVECGQGSVQLFDKILRDKVQTQNVFALNPTNLYYSSNDGASFTALTGTIAVDYAGHPTHAGEGIIASQDDVYVSTNYFASKASLGLASYASAEGGFTAVAYDPSTPTTVLAGGAKGGIYKTTNYNTSGSGVTWTKLTTPLSSDVTIRNIVIVHRNGNTYYYAAAFSGGVCFSPGTTPGLYRSINNGTWTALPTGLLPSNEVWKFAPLGTSPSTFVGAMWGGGVMELVDQQ